MSLLQTLCDARSRAGSAQSEASWSLVWCYERCYKSDADAFRSGLAELAESSHGTLLCFKKACGLKKWLAEASDTRWILVTDWREAKPCVQLWPECVRRPDLILVFTDGERQMKRSLGWQMELQEELRQKVRIVGSPCTVIPAIQKYVLSQQSDESRPRLNLSALLHECHEERQQEECQQESIYKHGSVCKIEQLPKAHMQVTMASTPFFNTCARCWSKPVAEVMASLVSSASLMEVQEMLTVAMPDCYED